MRLHKNRFRLSLNGKKLTRLAHFDQNIQPSLRYSTFQNFRKIFPKVFCAQLMQLEILKWRFSFEPPYTCQKYAKNCRFSKFGLEISTAQEALCFQNNFHFELERFKQLSKMAH